MSAATPELTNAEREAKARKRGWIAGLLVAFAYLGCALPLVGEYGGTWDCVTSEFPYGERLIEYVLTGDEAYLSLKSREPRPPTREPHPDFDWVRDSWVHAYPLGAILSGVSCRVLWTELGIVPAMAAHLLVIPLLVAGFLAFLVRFASTRIGLLAAVSSAILLAGSPRFFASSFFNLKDVPETCLYVSATLVGYVALTRGGLRWWIISGALTGLALAAKANALFVPPQYLVFLLFVGLVPGLRVKGAIRWSWPGFLAGTAAVFLANFAVSPRYWVEPIAGPVERFSEVMRLGNSVFDDNVTGGTMSFIEYAPLMISITTPLVVLVLALVGLWSRRLNGPLRAFLVAALFVTIGRNMLPGARNYGGIRHFLEFYPYFCLLAGVGVESVANRIAATVRGPSGRALRVLFIAGCLLAPAWQSARTHPNGIAYFNATIGGLRGARESNVAGATDYWGNSYWQAFEWLSENAEQDASVLVTVVSHVGHSNAPVRLRSDLRLRGPSWQPLTDPSFEEQPVVYITFITRDQAYHALEHELESRCEPVHEIRVQGGVVLRIYRVGLDDVGRELLGIWERQVDVRPSMRRIVQWLRANPVEGREALAIVRGLREVGLDETAERLRAHLPVELHEGLEDVLWTQIQR